MQIMLIMKFTVDQDDTYTPESLLTYSPNAQVRAKLSGPWVYMPIIQRRSHWMNEGHPTLDTIRRGQVRVQIGQHFVFEFDTAIPPDKIAWLMSWMTKRLRNARTASWKIFIQTIFLVYSFKIL